MSEKKRKVHNKKKRSIHEECPIKRKYCPLGLALGCTGAPPQLELRESVRSTALIINSACAGLPAKDVACRFSVWKLPHHLSIQLGSFHSLEYLYRTPVCSGQRVHAPRPRGGTKWRDAHSSRPGTAREAAPRAGRRSAHGRPEDLTVSRETIERRS